MDMKIVNDIRMNSFRDKIKKEKKKEHKICKKCKIAMKDIAATDWGDVWWCEKCGSIFCDFYNDINEGRWYIVKR